MNVLSFIQPFEMIPVDLRTKQCMTFKVGWDQPQIPCRAREVWQYLGDLVLVRNWSYILEKRSVWCHSSWQSSFPCMCAFVSSFCKACSSYVHPATPHRSTSVTNRLSSRTESMVWNNGFSWHFKYRLGTSGWL